MVAARDGDREALGALLGRHYPSTVRLCQRLLGNRWEAQDIAQEASLHALLGLDRLQDPARFGPWLHAIAANLARMTLRRRRHLSLELLLEGVEIVIWPRPAPTPESIQEARELHDLIIAALSELPASMRNVAIGYFLEGYSYAELADLLGVPLSTIKGRLFKGRRRLQERLGPLAIEVLRPDRRPPKELAMSDDRRVEVLIESVRKSLMTDHRVVVLRTRSGERDLPIWIGSWEGDVIALSLEGKQTERPLTHDLTLRLMEQLGATVRDVTISKIENSTFFAEIALVAGEQIHLVDARPSDALALAVRTAVPIFVAASVMEHAGVQVDPEFSPVLTYDPATFPRPSPFRIATWKYLGSLMLPESGAFDWDSMAAVAWGERFPMRDLELDGQPLTAVRLAADDDSAWLAVRPEMWQDVTTLAQRLIDQAAAVRAELEKARDPAAAADTSAPEE